MKKHRKLNLKKTNIASISRMLELKGGQGETAICISIFNMCRTKRANGATLPGQVACNNPEECR